MAEGKLHIKGTITIKSGKEKKKRKPRKKKAKKDGLADTGGYTGTGTATTKQEFGVPYSAQALMTAMALRPQITYQQPDLQQAQQMQQRSLEAPMYTFEDIPQLPYDAPIQTTKREIMTKAEPLLRRQIQEGIQQERELYQEEVYTAEQEKQRLRQQVEDMRQDVERQTQFFANEMERAQASFQKQATDLEQQAINEKKRMALERIQDKAKLFTDSVFDKAMFNVVSKTQQKEIEKSQQELDRLSREKAQVIRENDITRIGTASVAAVRQELKQIDPTFNTKNEDGTNKSADELRQKLLELKGLSQYAEPVPSEGRVGRPTKQFRPKQIIEGQAEEVRPLSMNEIAIEELKRRASEPFVMPEEPKVEEPKKKIIRKIREAAARRYVEPPLEPLDLQFKEFQSIRPVQPLTRQQAEKIAKKLELMPESSMERTLPNYVTTPYGVMTEERSRQTIQGIKDARYLDLAINENTRYPSFIKKEYMV